MVISNKSAPFLKKIANTQSSGYHSNHTMASKDEDKPESDDEREDR
jgi:hypothetical protein